MFVVYFFSCYSSYPSHYNKPRNKQFTLNIHEATLLIKVREEINGSNPVDVVRDTGYVPNGTLFHI